MKTKQHTKGFVFFVVLAIILLFFAVSVAAADQDGDGIPDDEDNCPTVYNPDQNESELPQGMVSYWTFDDGTATDVADDNNGIIYGAIPITGQINGALSFDGIDDYVDFGNDNILHIRDEITIEFWIYPIDLSNGPSFISKVYNVAWEIYYDPGQNKTIFAITINGSRYDAWQAGPSLNHWSHIAATYNGSEVRIYINNMSSDPISANGSIGVSPWPLIIGASSTGGGANWFFNGIIDEVAIYNRALTADEISEDYQEGLNGTGHSATDGYGDVCDNCRYVLNPDQNDIDGDSVGDACDNCPSLNNTDQNDMDGDDLGDVCDNCWYVANPNQLDDSDSDCSALPFSTDPQCGDACDPDLDNDGVNNTEDNCIYVINPGQQDADSDEFGDACDCDNTNAGIRPVRDGYVITSDIIVCQDTYNLPNGISIGADNIVLDCNGSTISGQDPGYGVGITLDGRTNVDIKDCIVKNALIGINLTNASYNTILDSTITEIGDASISWYLGGLWLSKDSTYNNISNVNTSNNYVDGIRLYGSYNTFTNITTSSNWRYGIVVDNQSSNNKFSHITALFSVTRRGILLWYAGENNSFEDVIANNNWNDGILIYQSSYSSFENVEANYNGGYGINVGAISSHNSFSNINVSGNSQRGIGVSGTYNSFDNIEASYNVAGIALWTGSDNNNITNSRFSNHTWGGIRIRSDNNLIKGNVMVNNGLSGIIIDRPSFGNTIIENNMTENYYNGISIRRVTSIQPYSGNNMWHSDLGNNQNTSLVRTFDLTSVSSATLTFWHNYYTEDYYDGGIVEVNNGSEWQQIFPVGGYPGIIDDWTGVFGGTPETPVGLGPEVSAYTGDSEGWVQAEFNLDDYTGMEIELRFRYASDSGYNLFGWVIDDIMLNEIGFFDDVESGAKWNVEGTGAVWTSSAKKPNLIEHNNIYSNREWNLNNWGGDVNAENNWWGTYVCDNISAMIYDCNDDPEVGCVDFEPYLNIPYPDGILINCSPRGCGNGVIDSGGEQCDDGNRIGFDGCSENCLNEMTAEGAINETGEYQIMATAKDNFDNTAWKSKTIKVDIDIPITTINLTGDYENGTYLGEVAVTLTASDVGSGVDKIYYRIDNSGWNVYTDQFTITKGGTTIIDYYSSDIAGNNEIFKTEIVEIAPGLGISWNGTITATNQLEPVTVGMDRNATDGFDAEFDKFSQVPQQGNVILQIDKLYSKSIKRARDYYEKVYWNLSIGVPEGQTTNLSLSVPVNVNLTVFNGSEIINPGTQLSEGAHNFLIVAELIEYGAFDIGLSAGWNMVSLPYIPDNTSVYSVFKDIPTLDIQPVVTWESPLFVQVENIEPKKGYWVFTPENITIHVIGRFIKNKTLELKTGWNMVGTMGLENLNLSSIPNQVPQNPPVTWEAPVFVEKNYTEPGTASWVFVISDTTLNAMGGYELYSSGLTSYRSEVITYQLILSEINFNLTISATNQLEPVTFGLHPDATNGFDAEFDIFTQLPQQGKVILSLDDVYSVEINKDDGIFEFEVGIPKSQSTTLSWDSSLIPSNLEVILGNISMKTQDSVYLEGDSEQPTSYQFIINITEEEISFNISLQQGWNLVSVPLMLENNSVENVFKTINYSQIFSYDLGWEVPTEINYTMGLWIKAENDDTLTIGGLEPENVLVNLKKGWNLIAYPSLNDGNVSFVFENVSDDLVNVFSYENSIWKSFDPNKNNQLNTLKIIKPGYGYWVNVNNNVSWSFDGKFE